MAMDGDELRAEGGEEMSGGMRLLVPRVKNGGSLVVGESYKSRNADDSPCANKTPPSAHPTT